ncbi:MAG: hypothetical protein IJ362_08045 [Oscillospiraceae bacterium]|nr:hypothetical protein [Oscillospiraceae bacterium]
MKDRTKKILTVIIFVTLLFNAYTAFSLRHTEKIIGESTLYSERQINSALNTAARCFLPILTECKVTKLYYDEEWNINRGGDKDTITVFCDFEVMYDTPVWEKGNSLHRWSWHMEKVCGIWIVTNYGFG